MSRRTKSKNLLPTGIHLNEGLTKTQPTRALRSNTTNITANQLNGEAITSKKRKNALSIEVPSAKVIRKTHVITRGQLKKLQSGQLKTPHIHNLPLDRCIRVVGKIKTDLNRMVTTMCCVNKHTMWIGRQVYDRLMKVTHKKTKELTTVKEFPDIDFVDFCYDKENDHVLYCDRYNQCVSSISSTFEFNEVKSFKPLCPTFITISPDNFLYIGLSNEYSYICSEQPCPRQIVKMDRYGTVHGQINSLHDGSSNFLFTQRGTINPVNNDLVVIGFKTFYEAYIANFNSEGINEFLYKDMREEITFTPRGLTCTTQGNILVSNKYNGDIHVLNKKGVCVRLLDMQDTQLPEIPWSLSWDFSGHLLIGTYPTETNQKASILITKYNDDLHDV